MEISYNVISLGTNSHNIMIHTMIQHNRKYATFSSTVCPQCVDIKPISLSFFIRQTMKLAMQLLLSVSSTFRCLNENLVIKKKRFDASHINLDFR